jgi:DNA polymerase-3 subunit epsilon
MLVNAPKFYEIAKRIIEITEGCILVAHNSSFDYRILKTEFRRLGFDFQRETLCTVELTKKLIPDLDSYSLGKLCKTLCIPVSNRHRAEGDALATVKLFKLLIDKDTDKEIIKSNIKQGIEKELSSKLQNILDDVPSETGVFYAHKENGDILYIGEGKNMKKSVNKLFFKTSKKGKLLQNSIASVTYEETGNDLISKLKYYNELRVNNPKFNFYIPKKVGTTTFSNPNLIIIDKGRHTGEKSVILVEDNKLLGFCFVDLAYQIEHAEVLKSLLTPIENNLINRHVFKTYLQKNKVEKIVRY